MCVEREIRALIALAFCQLVAVAQATQLSETSLRQLEWRAIGPAVMGGRIDDVAVDEKNPSTIYAGAASGGVWKTINAGTTWTPLFDREGVAAAKARGRADPTVATNLQVCRPS